MQPSWRGCMTLSRSILLPLQLLCLGMKQNFIYIVMILTMCCVSVRTYAQIEGVVIDSLTSEPLMYVSVFYEGKGVGSVTMTDGTFSIDSHPEWKQFSCSSIGYTTKHVSIIPGKNFYEIKLAPDNVLLSEVVVKPKKEKYSRKNNPAVDFMRQVMDHKKYQRLEDNEYYQYHLYEKMKMSLNDITPEKLEKGIYKKYAFLRDQIEVSEWNNSLILPVSVEETASKVIYRKETNTKKKIIKGKNSSGVNELFSSDDMMGTVLQDIFADVNIYDDEIRLLQRRFVSPIGKSGIAFYKYFLADTLALDGDSCIKVSFFPNNHQDYGFSGDLYVVKDSTYAVKRCEMRLPTHSAVNFVNRLDIIQNYEQLPNGNWALADDDVCADMSLAKITGGLQIERITKYNDYSFKPVENRLFRLKGSVVKESQMMNQSDEFWAQYRQVPLTHVESSMDVFMKKLMAIPGLNAVVFIGKAFIENFIETTKPGKPSKFDIGPINTIVSKNFVDGWRLRLSAGTTGQLHPHWFVSGYGAYGFKDKRWKYKGEVTYSFNKREKVIWEYPKHFLAASYSYEVMSPMDKFLFTDKDNMFVAFKFTTVDQMSYIREAALKYELETLTGFGVKASFRNINDEPTGNLVYWRNNETKMPMEGQKPLHDITTTEANITFRYAPGESFVNSKQRRIPVSLDAPVFTLSHTVGIKGLLGGDYNFNRTEASFWKRLWLPASWGKIDFSLKGGIEWNKVPFPMLILPEANLSYITQHETFCLINNMEFLNDRYASLSISYDMNGKLFNRIPFIKKLKWREMFRFRALWGTLTDKNNPFKTDDPDLFLFPMRDGQPTSFVMDRKMPYMEVSVGIYNIFKLLHVEYVRRLNYLDHPGVKKWGIRFMIQVVF